jgi:hypothetical protein
MSFSDGCPPDEETSEGIPSDEDVATAIDAVANEVGVDAQSLIAQIAAAPHPLFALEDGAGDADDEQRPIAIPLDPALASRMGAPLQFASRALSSLPFPIFSSSTSNSSSRSVRSP